ncbi:hypothetical protein PHYSODRAFT_301512 [Phytophthora sojae]|uniref:Uncharacterized protein n=1 Tax=Phytophthora sojae (strain P6497) TaxID=1094619 RepID=G4ZKS1_PHYSP|nr:hypothetical protein PHYSODRAFT_301512 [Phytophthora sojae]EGZ14517.1 hypothetical protein PHYSODRAFT_301512 [Phytophthora sojae]|eukprot:XP_009528266.1 hypothetical protein PHYSODRAFT_301512 [Phytophthora sojae]
MRVHEAVWRYAVSAANDLEQEYPYQRLQLREEDRRHRDSRWLRGSGGKKLRRAWLALQPSERERMMEATSDPTFPEGTDGVLDERTRTGRQLRLSRTRNRTETQHRLPTQEPLADLLLAGSTASNRPRIRDDVEHAVVEGELPRIFRAMTSVDTLNSARVNFYRVVEQETLVQLQADYNQGSLSGSIGIPRDRPSACAPSSRTSPPTTAIILQMLRQYQQRSVINATFRTQPRELYKKRYIQMHIDSFQLRSLSATSQFLRSCLLRHCYRYFQSLHHRRHKLVRHLELAVASTSGSGATHFSAATPIVSHHPAGN